MDLFANRRSPPERAVVAIIEVVLALHRFFELLPPLEAQGDYTRFTSTLGRSQGSQAELRYPVHKDVVAKMLRKWAVTLAGWRDRLAVVVATLCCLRPSDGARARRRIQQARLEP